MPNFEKDYMGVDNTGDNGLASYELVSKEDRPNKQALESQRDKYISLAIPKAVEQIRKDKKSGMNIQSADQLFSYIRIELDKDHNLDLVSGDEKRKIERELSKTYDDRSIAKLVLRHSRDIGGAVDTLVMTDVDRIAKGESRESYYKVGQLD